MADKIYELKPAIAEDEEFIYPRLDTERGYIGRLRGDFGKTGIEYWSTWETENDILHTVDFKIEFNDVMQYLTEKSDLPLLKNHAATQDMCKNMDSFKIKDKFADIYLFKIVTEKYTYFIRCFCGTGDYNFYIFAYNNEKLRKYKDIQLVEKHKDVIDREKFFKANNGFTHIYYNPDADAGGQIVYNEISHSLIWDALANDTSSDGFFEYIQSHCNQYLIDVGDLDFHDSFMSFVDDIAEFEGCTEETMLLLQDAVQKDLYSYSVDDNGVMTVWEGSSILCTIQDVSKKNEKDLFYVAVFEMRGISLDE